MAKANNSNEEMISIKRDIVDFHGEMVLLMNYSALNYTGYILSSFSLADPLTSHVFYLLTIFTSSNGCSVLAVPCGGEFSQVLFFCTSLHITCIERVDILHDWCTVCLLKWCPHDGGNML